MNKVMTAREAIDLIQDNMTFAFTGFVSFGLPEDLLITLEEKFINCLLYTSPSPRDTR